MHLGDFNGTALNYSQTMQVMGPAFISEVSLPACLPGFNPAVIASLYNITVLVTRTLLTLVLTVDLPSCCYWHEATATKLAS
jgi:hypothetical protein